MDLRQVVLGGRKRNVQIGDKCPIIVNSNIGANARSLLKSEIDKIDSLFSDPETIPDTMMDLSIIDFGEDSLYNYIIGKYGVPVGVVPIYTLHSASSAIEDNALLDRIEQLAKDGVSFMTMHFTADSDILNVAKRDRKIPVTSRGGGVVLEDNQSKASLNIYRRNIDKIINLALKYRFVISLGTTFRPASIVDACDEAHILETKRQIDLCRYLHSKGVSVMIENVGHIGINKIPDHVKLLKQANAPIMPLGPSIIDSAVGQDHVAAAIGAAFMGYYGGAHVINAISPSEHQNAEFTVNDTKQAIKAAKVAAKTVNCMHFPESLNLECDVYNNRASHKSCIFEAGKTCERCAGLCPLKLIQYEK